MKRLAVFVILGIAATLAISNRNEVTVEFFPLPYAVELPLFLVIILSGACGAIVGGLIIAGKGLKVKRECTFLRRRLNAVENELAALKPTPSVGT